jgi:integrase
MITGPRRGEISALRWRNIDFDQAVMWIQHSNAQPKSGIKDPGRLRLLASPDGSIPYVPRAITQRYRRIAIKLGLRSTRLHSLRHYSATELIAAGVDLRTVAGRLGHGSGGATTLKVYAAWFDEAERRAADTMASIIPRPVP